VAQDKNPSPDKAYLVEGKNGVSGFFIPSFDKNGKVKLVTIKKAIVKKTKAVAPSVRTPASAIPEEVGLKKSWDAILNNIKAK
jgi:hypothetical protein